MPDENMLRTPVPPRRPAAEELQQELTMTAGILRSAQGRLAEERDARLRARAGEELAMIDIRRAREEARQLKDERRAQDRKHVKALGEQRKALEMELKRAEGEQEMAIQALKREREQTAAMLMEAHADHSRELEEQLLFAQEEREQLVQEAQRVREQEAAALAKQAQETINAQLEADKEKRVEHLGKIGIKKLMNQKLAMGWAGWHGFWSEKVKHRNLLKKAGNRLLRPKLISSYTHWRHSWSTTQAAQATMTNEQRIQHEIAERRAVEAELMKLREELDAARETLNKDKYSQEALQLEMDRKLEHEKEARVQHLGQLGIKKLMNQKLAMGWSAWHGQWAEKVRQRNLLKKAGARLTKPKLLHAYSHWASDWKNDVRIKLTMTADQQAAAEAAERAELQAKLQAQIQELQKELKHAREAMVSGRGQEEELKRRMEEQIEKEKEKRVENLGQMGLKRLLNQKLAMGWGAWHGQWAEKVRQRNLLKKAGARLTKPRLIQSYQHWKTSWSVEMTINKTLTIEERLAAEIQRADAAEEQARLVQRDLKQARESMAAGVGQEAELKRRMEEELEREKEKRVAHLGEMGVKRLMNQGLARGWMAWSGMYTEYKRQRNLLKQAGARLTKPKLIHSYQLWRNDWKADMAAKSMMTAEGKAAQIAAEKMAAEEDLRKQLAAMQKELDDAKKRLGESNETAEEKQRRMEEELEAERDKRVANLGQMGLKRLLNQKLAMGWGAWHGQWAEKVRQRNLLKKAGARLTRPKLISSYLHWRRDWEIIQQARRSMTLEQRANAEAEEREKMSADLKAELDKALVELAEAREAMLAGKGHEKEMQRLMDEQLEKEKEKRVEALGSQGLKRIMNQKLAMGWGAWHGQWFEQRRQKSLLLKAGARLTKPKLIAAYSHWNRDWRTLLAARAAMTAEQRFAAEAGEKAALQADLQMQVDQLTIELQQARNAMMAGRGQEAELKRLMDEQLEKEKEKRVEALGSQGLKRIMNQKLAMGWTAWHGMWFEKNRQKNLLKKAGARLTKPKLIGAYSHWRRGWEAEMQLEGFMTQEQKLMAREEEKRKVEEENAKLRKELAETREAIAAGKGHEAELKRLAEEKLEREKEKRVEHLGQMGIKKLMNQKLSMGWMAWHGQWAEKVRQRNLLKKAGARLTKPKLINGFSHWRKDWEIENHRSATMSTEQKLLAEIKTREQLEKENAELRREVEMLRAAAVAGNAMELELKRRHEQELEREKEARVEHLGQMGIKKLMNQGLARGWGAWHGKWSEKVRQRNLLKKAGARLTKPKLMHGYSHWKNDWVIELKAGKAMTAEQKLAQERERRDAAQVKLEADYATVCAELKEAREAMAAGKGLELENRKRMEEELEREKEARVEHLGQMGIKRLMNQKLSMGWSAWHGKWSDKVHQRNLLKKAGMRLTKPKLINAYTHWRRDWEIENHLSATMSTEQKLLASQESERTLLSEVQELRRELDSARELMMQGKGMEAELRRRHEEELEREKEARVKHLGEMGIKKLMNQGLARGWSAWFGMWSDKVHQKNLLKKAGMRLTKPKLIASYQLWRKDWEMTEMAMYNMTHEQRLALEAEEKAKLQATLQSQVEKLALELKEAREAMMAGRGMQAELERQAEEALEAERAKRVEHLGQLGIKKLMNQGLARGWGAWHTMWFEKVRKRNLLKQAGARLTRPKVMAAYTNWRRSWEHEMGAEAAMTLEQKYVQERDKAAKYEAELTKMREELTEAREAMLQGKGQEAELKRLAEEQLEAERAARVEHLGQMGIKKLMNQKLSMGWTAWHGMWSDKVHQRNLLKKAGARLTKPKLIQAYTQWRRDWEIENHNSMFLTTEQKLLAANTENDKLAAELNQTRTELEALRKAALAGSAQEAELQRQMEEELERERAARVEHLGQLGIKRMMNQKLSMGWTAWHTMWADKVHQRNLLKKAGARLTKPKLIQAYQHWMRDWDAEYAAAKVEKAKLAAMSETQRLALETVNRKKAEEELAKVRAELKQARSDMAAGVGQEAERKRQMEEVLERERQKRVEHLGQLGIKRLLNQKLAMGWSAWHGKWAEKVHQRNLLKKAGARLTKPKLMHAYSHWRKDYEIDQQLEAHMSTEQKLLQREKEKAELEEGMAKLRKELAEAREAMVTGRGQEAELQRRMQEQLEAERAKRVEHLGQLGIKKLMNQKLAMGWAGWHTMWEEKVNQRNLLKKAGARLMKPKLISSYMHWRNGWQLEMQTDALMSQEERIALDSQSKLDLKKQIDKLEADLKAANELIYGSSGLQNKLEEDLEAEREKRVAHLGQLGIKKMMNQKLAMGWTAWHDQWSEKVRQRNLLKKAGARLTKPRLIQSYSHWKRDWDAAKAARRNMTITERLAHDAAEAQAEKEALYTQVDKLTKELKEAREAMVTGRGQEAELKRLAEEQLEAERAKRVEHLGQMGVKKLMNQGLARGWGAWHSMWETKVNQRNLLKKAGARLVKPKLIASYQHWRKDWEIEVQKGLFMTTEQKLLAEKEEKELLTKEVNQLRKELEGARAAMISGKGQEAEMQRRMQEKIEAERAKRIEHLGEMSLRRILKGAIARGFTAWADQYYEHTRRMRMLQQAGSRLAKPKLAAAYQHWMKDWDLELATARAEEARLAAMSNEERLAHEQTQATNLRAQNIQLAKELKEARDAMASGRGEEYEMRRRAEEELEREKEKRVAHLGEMGVKRLMNMGLARGWTAWHELYTEKVNQRNLLKKAASRLTRPKMVSAYSHWLLDFQIEIRKGRYQTTEQKLLKKTEEATALHEEVEKLRKELEKSRSSALAGRGQEAELKRLMEEELEKEREKRVAHLAEMGVKRLMNQGLSRGWSAWYEVYAEGVRKRNLLKQAANRLMKPKQTAAYSHWRRHWHHAESSKKAKTQALANMTYEQRIEYEAQQRLKIETALAQTQAELREARKAALSGNALEHELRKQHEEQLAAERDKRVAALSQVGVKRMVNLTLARGWSTWHYKWEVFSRRKGMLMKSLARLMKPKIVRAFAHWMHDWDVTMLAQSAAASSAYGNSESEGLKAKLEATTQKLENEIEKLKKELSEARKAMLEGRGQEAEQLRLLEDQVEAEKTKRIDALSQQGIKRLMNRELSLGWTAWHSKWAEKNRLKNLLKKSATMLTKPKMAANYYHWRRDWEHESANKRRQLMMTESQKRQAETEARLQQLEDDYGVRLTREVERRSMLEQELQRSKLEFDEQLALTHVALVEARKAATDAINRASVERASADAAKRASEDAAQAEMLRMNEMAKRESVEQDLRRFQQDTDEEIALQHVALVEARKAATDALTRLSIEQSSAEAARRSVSSMEAEIKKSVFEQETAVQEVDRLQNLLQDQHMASEEKLSRLLEEHRTHLTKEIVRLSDDYERQLAELRMQLARFAAQNESMNSARSAASPVKVRTLLAYDPDKTLVQLLRDQVARGLRLVELFNELDENGDGYVTREEWIKGFAKVGPSLPEDFVTYGFDTCDKDGSGSINFQEVDKWVKSFSPVNSRPASAEVVKKEKKEPPKKKTDADKKRDRQATMLTALASSMGVRPERTWFDQAQSAQVIGKTGESEFEAMMAERASAFGRADINNDGKLDFDEFKDLVHYRETTAYTDKQLKEKFADLDVDGSGSVDLPEFIAYSLRDALKRSKGRAIDLFRVWDEDDSGYIDKAEFGKAIVALGFVAGREDINKVFDMLDEDGSGQIEYKELNTILKKGSGSGAQAATRPSSGGSSKPKPGGSSAGSKKPSPGTRR